MHKYILLIIVTLLSSCTSYQKNKYHNIETPKSWHTKSTGKNIEYSNRSYNQLWWQNFNDENLKKIVQCSIDNNLDYKIALARIEYAKAKVISSQSILYPDISLEGKVEASKYSSISSSITKKTVRSENAGLKASWEIDLFGQNRNIAKSSNALLKSTIHKADYVLISIVSETINSYLEYKATAKALHLAKKTQDIEEVKLKLMKVKLKQGLVSEIDVSNQNTTLLTNKVETQKLSDRLMQLEYKIETLCNKTPGSLYQTLKGTNMPSFNQKILINSPIKIIRQRPDIISANYELLSATSVTKSSIAKQFPSINLEAAFGYQNSDLTRDHHMWSLGKGLLMPLISFGRIKAEINMSKASEQEAFLKYQQNIYKALEDVESALSYYKSNLDNYNSSQKIVSDKQKNLTLIKHKYKANTIEYTEVLDAEKSLYHAEKELSNNQAIYNQSLVRLSKSLGHKVVN